MYKYILIAIILLSAGLAVAQDESIDLMLGDSSVYNDVTPSSPMQSVSGYALKAYANPDSITIINFGSSRSPVINNARVVNSITNEVYANLPSSISLGMYEAISLKLENATAGEHLLVTNGIGIYAETYILGYKNA